jgi:hypothetical protein
MFGLYIIQHLGFTQTVQTDNIYTLPLKQEKVITISSPCHYISEKLVFLIRPDITEDSFNYFLIEDSSDPK